VKIATGSSARCAHRWSPARGRARCRLCLGSHGPDRDAAVAPAVDRALAFIDRCRRQIVRAPHQSEGELRFPERIPDVREPLEQQPLGMTMSVCEIAQQCRPVLRCIALARTDVGVDGIPLEPFVGPGEQFAEPARLPSVERGHEGIDRRPRLCGAARSTSMRDRSRRARSERSGRRRRCDDGQGERCPPHRRENTIALDLVLEGTAGRITDTEMLSRIADVYAARGWPLTVGGDVVRAPFWAPTAPPPPLAPVPVRGYHRAGSRHRRARGGNSVALHDDRRVALPQPRFA
jgi:hypothetical protein